MRILQVHTRYRRHGGEDTTVENERRLLADAGHAVLLHEAQNSRDVLHAARQLAQSSWNAGEAKRLGAEIERFRPHVVHAHNTWFALSPSVLAAATRSGVPVVLTLQNYRLVCVSSNLFRDSRLCEDCVGKGPWRGVMHRCYHDSVVASGVLATHIAAHRRLGTWRRQVDTFVAVSEYGVARHVAGGVPRGRIVVKDNFAHDPGPRESPPASSDEVLFVGRHAPEKGLGTLLSHWAEAETSGMRLVVIGPGALPPGAHRDDVVFAGSVPSTEVTARMKLARALVFPSEWPEGQPLVLLEALAAGLPIVGSALGGTEEVLRDVEHCWRVPVGDAPGWRKALSDIRDDDAVDIAGQSSRDLYERRFSPGRALSELEGVYELAMARHGGLIASA